MIDAAEFCRCAMRNGEVIELVISAFYRTAPLSGTALDGGAHTGYHTTQLVELDQFQKIIAVEPCAETHRRLRDKVGGLTRASKVEYVEAALQDNDEVKAVRFYQSANHPGRNGVNPIMRLYDTNYEVETTVAATTIDRLTSASPFPTGFIKLDLEGYEFAALKGGRKTLQWDRPAIVYENGGESPKLNGYAPEEFFAFWRDLGYLPVTAAAAPMLTEQDRLSFWYGWAFPHERAVELTTALERAIVSELGLTP